MEDESVWVRRAATKALGHIGDSSAVEPLTRGLADDSPWVRRSAAYALGAMRAGEAASGLISALADPDAQVRRNAAWALGRIGDPLALPDLRALLADDALAGQVAREAQIAIDVIRRPAWQRLPRLAWKLLARRGTGATPEDLVD
jgi:HEAT repeat protein